MKMLPKILMLIVLTLSCAYISLAAVAIALNTENPEHPGKCWTETYKQAIDVDTKWQPDGVCDSFSCSKSSEKSQGYVINIIGCGKIGKSDEYDIVQNLSLPHPDCCPTIIPHRRN